MITSMFTLLDLNIRKKIAPLNTQKDDRPSTKIKQRSPLNTSSRNDRPLNISTLRSPLQKNQTAIAPQHPKIRSPLPKKQTAIASSTPKITIASSPKPNSDRPFKTQITIASTKNQTAIDLSTHQYHNRPSKKIKQRSQYCKSSSRSHM
ncbi:MAG: hypothetical protein ACK54E_07315 [Pseudanabaena sp.]